MDEIKAIVAVNIKKYRERLGITQEVLAERCDLSPQYLAALEVGIKTPSLASIERIINALGIRPYQLFLTDSDEDIPAMGISEFSEKVISVIRDLERKHNY